MQWILGITIWGSKHDSARDKVKYVMALGQDGFPAGYGQVWAKSTFYTYEFVRVQQTLRWSRGRAIRTL